MTALIFYSAVNTPGRRDASGAFAPESIALLDQLHREGASARRVPFDRAHPKGALYTLVHDELQAEQSNEEPIDFLAWVCHGLRTSVDTGHNTRNVDAFAALMRPALSARVSIMACSTSASPKRLRRTDGEGGFADALRDALVREGCIGGWVDGHTVPGHCTSNPFVRRMHMRPGDEGGEWIVPPRSKLWARWCAALRDRKKSTLRLRFSRMSIDAIHAELELGER